MGLHVLSETFLKKLTTRFNPVIEYIKLESQCYVQYPNTEEFKVFQSRKEDCVMFDVASIMINNLNLNFANC